MVVVLVEMPVALVDVLAVLALVDLVLVMVARQTVASTLMWPLRGRPVVGRIRVEEPMWECFWHLGVA